MWQRMKDAEEHQHPYEFDFRIVRADGVVRVLHVDALIDRDANGQAIRWRGTDQDVTERVKAEEEQRRLDDRLRTTQRWEALGQLAGGVAHDFNNLMAGVLGNATLAREQLPADSPLHEHLLPIEDAAHHAASLCQQLLAFAGRGTVHRSEIELQKLINDSVELLRMGVPRAVELRIGTTQDLPVVEGDRSQLKQVLLNLVWNAAEAIGPDGGVIEIRTGSSRGGCCNSQGAGHYCTTLPAWPVCLARSPRHRLRHSARSARTHVRSVLHHEGHGPRPRALRRRGDRPQPWRRGLRHLADQRRHQRPRLSCGDRG